MANQLDNEIVSDETKQDERNTKTAASSSREYDSTEVQGNATDARCTVPLCGLVYYVMGFFGFFCMSTQRVSLSVAIVAMVNQTALTDDDEMSNVTNTSDTYQCPRDPELHHIQGEFTWDRHEQAAALAVFSYGQVVSQVRSSWYYFSLILTARRYASAVCVTARCPYRSTSFTSGVLPEQLNMAKAQVL